MASERAIELLADELDASHMPFCAKSVRGKDVDRLAILPSVALRAIDAALQSTLPPELIELSKRATGGEWQVTRDELYTLIGVPLATVALVERQDGMEVLPDEANAAFIVATVNHIRSIIGGETGDE